MQCSQEHEYKCLRCNSDVLRIFNVIALYVRLPFPKQTLNIFLHYSYCTDFIFFQFEMDAIEKTIHILNRVAAKVLELRSPTIDQNLYKLLHKITSYLIEILSPQETLVDEWLQQSIDKQVHVKPDLEILDFQNGNSDIKDKQSLKNLNFKDEVLSGNNHTDVDSSVIKQKLNNSFNRAPVNKNTEARKIGNHEEFIGSFDNASTNHKPDLTNVAVSLAGQKYEDQIRRMFHGYLEAVIQVHHSLLQVGLK